MHRATIAALLLFLLISPGRAEEQDLTDPAEAWRAVTAPGTTLRIDAEEQGRGLRLTYDFAGTMSYVVAARDVDVTLPDSFELSLLLKRSAPDARLEMKLVDSSGAVFMHKWYEFGPVGRWKRVVFERRDFLPPTPEAQPLTGVATVELAITGGLGQGEIAIDELMLAPAGESPGKSNDAGFSYAGARPRWLLGEQAYWTLIGVPDDEQEVLLCEDGTIEPYKRGFALVPLLRFDERLFTRDDAQVTPSLEQGHLPLPSVRWSLDGATLDVTAYAHGEPDASRAVARYRVTNRREEELSARLYLVALPYQVYPPWQGGGGIAPIHDIRYSDRTIRINDELRVELLTQPAGFAARPAEELATGGSLLDVLAAGTLPEAAALADESGFAAGAAAFDLTLHPHEYADVYVAFPLHEHSPVSSTLPEPDDLRRTFEIERHDVARQWDALTGHVALDLPDRDFVDMVRANLAYNLITRDGAALQPGSRSYDKAWMRDGALAANALLEMGRPQEAMAFVEWMGSFQQPSGEIPPVVDTKAEDPLWEEKRNGLVEYDSQGEFVWSVLRCYRMTRDEAFLERMYPGVVKALQFLEHLRGLRLGPAYERGSESNRVFYGLLPPSNSHEGYYMKHSYWDDFWGLLGWEAGRNLATYLDRKEDADWMQEQHDALRESLVASIRRVMARDGIDYLPGCAELGDFDPTASAVAVTYAERVLEEIRPDVECTFKRYRDEALAPRLEEGAEYRYTPYEVRNVPALLRLGCKKEAWTLLRFLMDGRRPRAWQHLAEVVHSDDRFPTYIGDMPHTWVGAEFLHAARTMLVDEWEGRLVLARGVPDAWLARGPVAVRNMPTRYGALAYRLEARGATVRLQVNGDLRTPPGGYAWVLPRRDSVVAATLDGRRVDPTANGELVFTRLPADLEVVFAGDTWGDD